MAISSELRKIRRLRAGLAFSLILLALSVCFFYLAPWSASVRESIVLVSVVFYALITLRLVFIKCPRCGQLFHNVLGFRNPLSRKCSHCSQTLDRHEKD
jgi:hypothetical protein